MVVCCGGPKVVSFLALLSLLKLSSAFRCCYMNPSSKCRDKRLFSSTNLRSQIHEGDTIMAKPNAACFDDVVRQRYACSRFRKNDAADPQVIKDASEVLDLSRRAPSGFNAQPYRAILVSSPEAKEKLSKYCIGRNADRVRDSDCTVVFLADKEYGREMSRFGQLIRERDASVVQATNRKPLSNFAIRKIQAFVLLFSSGYPLPRFLASPISFCVRVGVAAVSVLTRRRVLVPSLSSAECWATKNCMLFAMSYILGCTSRNLATCPMEGSNAGGIRKALRIPKRFVIPLIVSTGKPYASEEDASDDVGVSHGASHLATSRYPANQVLYQNEFGGEITSITE